MTKKGHNIVNDEQSCSEARQFTCCSYVPKVFFLTSRRQVSIQTEEFVACYCRFIRRFVGFCLYFCIFFVAFYLRPGTDTRPTLRQENRTENGESFVQNITVKDPCYLLKIHSWEDTVHQLLSLENWDTTLELLQNEFFWVLHRIVHQFEALPYVIDQLDKILWS